VNQGIEGLVGPTAADDLDIIDDRDGAARFAGSETGAIGATGGIVIPGAGNRIQLRGGICIRSAVDAVCGGYTVNLENCVGEIDEGFDLLVPVRGGGGDQFDAIGAAHQQVHGPTGGNAGV